MTPTATAPAPFELAYSTACFPLDSRAELVATSQGAARWCEVALPADERVDAGAWRQALADAGMKCWSVHAPFGQSVDLGGADDGLREAAVAANLEAADAAVTLGARLLVVHAGAEPMPVSGAEREERLRWSREGLLGVHAACSERGLAMALEFLPRTCLGNSVAELEWLLSGLPWAEAGVCMDVNHANLGQSVTANIVALAGRIVSLHVSDNDGTTERHWLPGQGAIVWGEVLAALRGTGYRGPCVYESSRDRQERIITPRLIRENYDRVILPLLAKE
jgi:sugar phosphate isomerase/epimerase